MTMGIELLVALLLTLAGFGILWLQLRKVRGELMETLPGQLTRDIHSRMTEALQKPLMDLMERNARVATETRDSIMERLSKNIQESQERMDRSLAQSRTELQNGLFKTTQALETK